MEAKGAQLPMVMAVCNGDLQTKEVYRGDMKGEALRKYLGECMKERREMLCRWRDHIQTFSLTYTLYHIHSLSHTHTLSLAQTHALTDALRASAVEFEGGRRCSSAVRLDASTNLNALSSKVLKNLVKMHNVECPNPMEKGDFVRCLKAFIEASDQGARPKEDL